MKKSNALEFKLDQIPDPERALSRGLTVCVSGKAVWPVEGDSEAFLEIQIDDLLSYLTDFWKPLLLRQTYPILGSANSPSDYLRRMKNRWEESPDTLVEKEGEIVQAFEEAHNLAVNFGGQFGLPVLWLIRDREEMICEAGDRIRRLPFHDAAAEFSRVGDSIASVLSAVPGGRWKELIDAWHARDRGDAVSLVAWSASLQPAVAETLVARGRLVPPETVSDAANDNDPLRIAARLAGGLPAEQIECVIDLARSFKAHAAENLEKLSAACVTFLDELPRSAKAFHQGEEIARHVRSLNGVSHSESLDIFSLVKQLGVEVRVNGRVPENLEGLAIAGPGFGPGGGIL